MLCFPSSYSIIQFLFSSYSKHQPFSPFPPPSSMLQTVTRAKLLCRRSTSRCPSSSSTSSPRSRTAAGALPRRPACCSPTERDGRTHQCKLVMINDKALVQTKSLSTQLSFLVIAGNTRNVVCNTSFTRRSGCPAAKLRPAVGGRAVVEICSLPQPAQFFVRKRSSEKSEVLVTMSVLEEKLRRGDRARARHVAADHAARRHSSARGRGGAVQALAVPAEAAPVMVRRP